MLANGLFEVNNEQTPNKMTEEMQLPKSRLGSLYKDFRDMRELNKDGYEANVNTWKNFILKTRLNDKTKLTLHCGPEWLSSFRIDVYGEPKSIDVALDSLIEENVLLTTESFHDPQRRDIDKTPREGNLLSTLFSYLSIGKTGISTRKHNTDTSYLKQMNLIIKDNVKDAAAMAQKTIKEDIVEKSSSPIDLIMDTDTFKNRSGISKTVKSESDQEIILYYLEHYTQTIVRDHDVVKIIPAVTSEENADSTKEITESDINIVQVKTTISKLEREIVRLGEDIDSIISKQHSKEYHELSRESQKAMLKSRILAQRFKDRLTGNKENLTTVMQELRTSSTNKMIVDTLQKSHDTLKTINDSIGPVEKIEELMDSISEQQEISQQVTDTLANTDIITESIPDSEIEDELAELEKQMESKTTVSSDKEEEEVLSKLKNLRVGTDTLESSNAQPETHKEEDKTLISET